MDKMASLKGKSTFGVACSLKIISVIFRARSGNIMLRKSMCKDWFFSNDAKCYGDIAHDIAATITCMKRTIVLISRY
jgi:hypothetical protein